MLRKVGTPVKASRDQSGWQCGGSGVLMIEWPSLESFSSQDPLPSLTWIL